MGHLSRFAEELILWVSQGFNFISLVNLSLQEALSCPKNAILMVQLIREKQGRAYGNLIALLTVTKSLALAYSKDLQEDKEPVFDSYETIISSLKVMSGMVKDLVINKKEC